MKKTFKTVLTMLLVLTMLFGVASPAIAEVLPEPTSASSGSNGSSSSSSSGDPVLGEEDIGEWLHIEYTANGLVVEFDPVVKSILSTTKEDIVNVISLVVEAAKTLIIDDMKEGIFGDTSADLGSLNKNEILTFALDGYLKNEYPDISDEGERYLTFFEDVINDDQNVKIAEFVTYACDLIKAAVGANIITLEELPDASKIESELTTQFEKILNEQVDAKVDEYVITYITWIEGGLVGEVGLPAKVRDFIDAEIETYVNDIIDAYIAAGFNAPANATNVESLVADYINKELVQFVKDSVDAYGRKEVTEIDSIIKAEIDKKIKDILDNYPDDPNSNPIFGLVDSNLDGAIDDKIDEYVTDFLNGTLKDAEMCDIIEAELEIFKVQYKNKLATALWDEYWADKADGSVSSDYTVLDDKIAEYVFTNYSIDSYTSMTAADVEAAIALDGISFDEFKNSAITEIEDAVTSDEVNVPWADIWAKMSDTDKDDLVAEVKATQEIKDKINEIVNEYWASNGDQLLDDKRTDIVNALASANDYDAIIDEFVEKAKVEYADTIESKIDEIIGEESLINLLSDVLADLKADDPAGYASIIDAVKAEVNSKTESDSFLDTAFQAYFGDGITKSYILDTKVPEYVAIFKTEYEAAKQYINDHSGYLALIELVNGVTVNNHKIFSNENGIQFIVSEIKALVAETVPSFSEVAGWSDDEMQFNFDINVDTSVGAFDFSVTAKLTGGHDKVRRIAEILANNVVFDIDDRNGVPTLVLHVNVPEKFAELLIRACDSDKVPDKVKHAVFKLLDVTANGAYGYIEDNNYTDFDALLELFNSLPIDELLDKYVDQTFLSRFEVLENLTQDQIEAKLIEYRAQIQQVIDFVVNFYNNRVPADFKDKTVGSFYKGDGKFAFAKDSYTVNIAKLLDKISDKLGNDKIGAIAGLIDVNEITAGVDLSLTFEAVKSVTFMVADENGGYKEHSKGFLPAGADLDYFANIFADSKGYPIVSWSTDEDGSNTVADGKMPDADVVLYANYGDIKVSLKGVDSEYTGSEFTLTVEKTIATALEGKNLSYAYQWYRADSENGEGTAIAGATSDTYTVKDASDTGYYYVEVTVSGDVNDTLTTNRAQVNITKPVVNVNEAVEWLTDAANKYTDPFTFVRDEADATDPYAGLTQSVTPSIADGFASLIELDLTTLAGNEQSDAGSYTATVRVKIIDSNYVFAGGVTEIDATLSWAIDPIKYYESDIVWSTATFTYEWRAAVARMRSLAGGSAVVHEMTIEELYGIETEYQGNTASDAGEYEASVTLTSKDGNVNYVYAGAPNAPELKKSWTVETREIDIDTYEWNYNAADEYWTYSAEEKTASLVGLPGDIVVNYTGNTATNAGSYSATATIAPNDNYSIIGDNSSELDWAVAKAQININDITWNYEQNETVATYGETFDDITFNNPAYIHVVYGGDGRTQTNAGTYTTTVTVQHEDNTNYECVGGTLSLTWTIAKKDITAADIELVDRVYNEAEQNAALSESWTWYTELGQYVTVNGTGEDATTHTASVSIDISAAPVKNFTFAGEASATDWQVEWTITPMSFDLSTLTWNYSGTPFVYNETEQSVVITNLGKITVVYANNAKTDAGEYTATATADPAENTNYTFTGEITSCDWEIDPATIDLGELVWRYDGDVEKYVYNATEQGVYLYGKDADDNWVKIENFVYTGNTATNAGEYTAEAAFGESEGNYIYTGTFASEFKWNIAKAKYDVSGLVFNDLTVVYDGQEHSVVIAGTLPDGVTVEYVNNAKTEVGVYKVTAVFKGDFDNYEEITEKFEATLTITAAAPELKKEHLIYIDGVHVITVTAANGVNANFNSTAVDVTDDYDIFRDYEIFGDGKYGKVGVAYDITFTNNGDIQEVSDTFTVKMLLPENIRNKENLKLLYVAPDGSLEDLEFTIEGENAVFETTHFSVYAMAEVVNEPTDWSWLWIVIAILLVIIIILLVLLLLKKRSGNKNENEISEVIEVNEEAAAPAEEEAEEVVEEETVEEVVEEAPEETVEEAEAEEAVEETVEEETVEETVEEEEAPAEEPAVEEPTVEEPAVEEPAVEEPAVEEPTVEEPAVEEPTVEEPTVEEPAVEEPAVEEPAVEEPTVEEPAVEEPTVEEPAPATEPEIKVVPVVEVKSDDDEDDAVRIINGEEIHVRYRSSFMSRLIQAEPPIQDYYTEVKNELLSYKGVKARTSWNFESFNKGRIQCAKLNIKGKNFMVYLGLDPKEYNASKYHFVDVSDKPKLDKVPMMLKVKSERGLKYAIELIEEMMKNFEIEKTENPNVDYHMPYETTEELVARDLVKVILPAGVTLDENSNIVKADVGAIIDKANEEAEKEEKEEKAEAPVIETPVEEPVVETEPEATAEEPAVEEPAVEEPAVEEPAVEELAVEEPMHLDAVHADEIVTDEEAVKQIDIVEKTEKERSLGNKLCEINLDTICENFEDGETVNLAALKTKRLAGAKYGRVKVLARGVMTKSLTIYADKFSLQAVKMITLAGGHAEQYK